MNERTFTLHLPSLDIEIGTRSLPKENAEALMIRLKATPSFDHVARWLMLPHHTPFQGLAGDPFSFWAGLVQSFWEPWLQAANAFMPTQGNGE